MMRLIYTIVLATILGLSIAVMCHFVDHKKPELMLYRATTDRIFDIQNIADNGGTIAHSYIFEDLDWVTHNQGDTLDMPFLNMAAQYARQADASELTPMMGVPRRWYETASWDSMEMYARVVASNSNPIFYLYDEPDAHGITPETIIEADALFSRYGKTAVAISLNDGVLDTAYDVVDHFMVVFYPESAVPFGSAMLWVASRLKHPFHPVITLSIEDGTTTLDIIEMCDLLEEHGVTSWKAIYWKPSSWEPFTAKMQWLLDTGAR